MCQMLVQRDDNVSDVGSEMIMCQMLVQRDDNVSDVGSLSQHLTHYHDSEPMSDTLS
jgi:hypothetical protein